MEDQPKKLEVQEIRYNKIALTVNMHGSSVFCAQEYQHFTHT